jgi:hypothetical protein
MKRTESHCFAALLLESMFILALLAITAKAEPILGGIGTQTLGGRFVWSDEVISTTASASKSTRPLAITA